MPPNEGPRLGGEAAGQRGSRSRQHGDLGRVNSTAAPSRQPAGRLVQNERVIATIGATGESRLKVRTCTLRGVAYCDIRWFMRLTGREPVPTKRGVMLRAELLAELVEALVRAGQAP